MSSPTLQADELVALSLAGQENMVPAAEEARPHTFLSLAPATSSSYPVKKPSPKSPVMKAAASPKLDASIPEVVGMAGLEKTRRSSSLSSNGSLNQKRRFLKLGPVHHGVHEGEEGDWSEEVIVS